MIWCQFDEANLQRPPHKVHLFRESKQDFRCQSLFEEFQIKTLLISKSKVEGEEGKLFVGVFCENASKHTFHKKIKDTFSSSEYTIYKIESKKGVGPLAFELLGEEKELIISVGENLCLLHQAATSFQQHRAITPLESQVFFFSSRHDCSPNVFSIQLLIFGSGS